MLRHYEIRIATIISQTGEHFETVIGSRNSREMKTLKEINAEVLKWDMLLESAGDDLIEAVVACDFCRDWVRIELVDEKNEKAVCEECEEKIDDMKYAERHGL